MAQSAGTLPLHLQRVQTSKIMVLCMPGKRVHLALKVTLDLGRY